MKTYLTRLQATSNDYMLTFLRIVLAVVMFAHGAQKMLGWFGGHGPTWTVEMWGKWFGFPSFLTWLVIIGEFVAPFLLFTGFLTRMAATIVALIMAGAIYFVHGKWGFYMNWYSEQGRGEGIEIHLLILAISAVLMVRGGGALSGDKALESKLKG